MQVRQSGPRSFIVRDEETVRCLGTSYSAPPSAPAPPPAVEVNVGMQNHNVVIGKQSCTCTDGCWPHRKLSTTDADEQNGRRSTLGCEDSKRQPSGKGAGKGGRGSQGDPRQQKAWVPCSHLLFVMVRVCETPSTESLVLSRSLKDFETDSVLERYRSRRRDLTASVAQFGKQDRTCSNDVCAICLNELTECRATKSGSEGHTEKLLTEDVIFCEDSCHNGFHKSCMKIWCDERTSIGEPITCPLCRHGWKQLVRPNPPISTAKSQTPMRLTHTVSALRTVPTPQQPFFQRISIVFSDEVARSALSPTWTDRKEAIYHIHSLVSAQSWPKPAAGISLDECWSVLLDLICSAIAERVTPINEAAVALLTACAPRMCAQLDHECVQPKLATAIIALLRKTADARAHVSRLACDSVLYLSHTIPRSLRVPFVLDQLCAILAAEGVTRGPVSPLLRRIDLAKELALDTVQGTSSVERILLLLTRATEHAHCVVRSKAIDAITFVMHHWRCVQADCDYDAVFSKLLSALRPKYHAKLTAAVLRSQKSTKEWNRDGAKSASATNANASVASAERGAAEAAAAEAPSLCGRAEQEVRTQSQGPTVPNPTSEVREVP